MNTTTIGRQAELIVAAELSGRRHRIIDKNWRRRHCEIDIISQCKNIIYFTEVKFRKTDQQGDGFEYINITKQSQMEFAARSWCAENNWDGDYRLMAAAVGINGGKMIISEMIELA
jgi:ribonuclease HII